MTISAAAAPDPACLSIEALDHEIVSLTRTMTATEYALLVRVREFDERGGWLKWGATGCAEWLHWRCDLSLSAAREKVRMAHALKTLPAISRSFAVGDLSYSKVRALTRVANVANEAELLDFAQGVSAAIVEERCRQLRNVRPEATAIAARAYESRRLYASRQPDAARMTLTVELPLEDGELVLNALDKVMASFDGGTRDLREAADVSTSYGARQVDALVTLCRGSLVGGALLRGGIEEDGSLRGGVANDSSTPRSHLAETYQVVVHVDAAALTGANGSGARSDLPLETVRRLTCDGAVVPVWTGPAEGANGDAPPQRDQPDVLHIGRRQRTVPAALRRALSARDRQCRFPGCGHRRFVEAHHVRPWGLGGGTDLDNLVLLCGHHHRLVHEGGFHIHVDNDGELFFRRPDGRAVPACGYRREDREDEDQAE